MGFRTIVIKSRAKLDFSLNYLVCRSEKEKRIHLDEISILIIESTAVSLTAALLSELVKKKIKVIFCDEKHLPSSQLIGFDDNYHSVKRIIEQVAWDDETKGLVWQNIIENKINNQRKLLCAMGIDDERLNSYISEVKVGDKTNREGHSAKVYFNLLGCSGRRVDSEFNSALNYGYAVLLAMFCRSITANGLITQLGIWHRNEFNPYNLASDMMETYRVIVDDLALNIQGDNANFKYQMANLGNCKVFIDNKWLFMESGIDLYVKSLINALNCKNVRYIKNFTKYELSIYENTGNV